MTLTATRDDNEGFFTGLFAAKPKAIDPTALVNTALASFQQAADNLVAAQGLIDAQKEEHMVAMGELSAKITQCSIESSRLTRIKERLAEFLA